MAKGKQNRISINMTLEENVEFIQRLATDDAFRKRLQEDPQRVLAEYHIEAPAHMFCFPVKLPSKTQLRIILREIRKGFEDPKAAFRPFVFYVFFAFRPAS